VKGINEGGIVIASMAYIADLQLAYRAGQIKKAIFEQRILRPTIFRVGETAAADRENLYWLCHTPTFFQ
jgi:hypothetical protein